MKIRISIPNKQGNCLELPLSLFVTGIKRIGLRLLELHQDIDCTLNKIFLTYSVAILLLKRKRKLFMLELAQKSKKMTFKDKSIFSNPNFPYIPLLQTLVLGLIGKEKALKPFWNNHCLDLSQKLWLPIETDFVVSDSNSSRSSLIDYKLNSLFSIEKMENPQGKILQTISSQLSTSIPVEKWEKDDTLRSRKVRIYPTQKQKKMYRNWVGTTRYVYNRALEHCKKNSLKFNFQSMRNKFVTKKNNPDVQDWEVETPKDVRAGGLKDLEVAFKSAFSNLKNGNITKFDIKFRSKKNPFSLRIPKTAITKMKDTLSIYTTYCKEKIKVSKDKFFKTLKEIEYDCRLKIENKKWFICIPFEPIMTKNDNNDVCALDPGIRKFQTIYSEKEVVKITMDKELITRYQQKLSLYQSLRSRGYISKFKCQRGLGKIYDKINNKVDNLHYKTINNLIANYKTIFIPNFENQEIIKVVKGKKTRSLFSYLKHFSFKERLKQKASKTGTNVVVCTEEYTSKTCTRCGSLKEIGRCERYNCSSCMLNIDRDVNGARNILIKNLCKVQI